jgi:hypothetical protein
METVMEVNELPKTAPDHAEVDSLPEQEEHGLDGGNGRCVRECRSEGDDRPIP